MVETQRGCERAIEELKVVDRSNHISKKRKTTINNYSALPQKTNGILRSHRPGIRTELLTLPSEILNIILDYCMLVPRLVELRWEHPQYIKQSGTVIPHHTTPAILIVCTKIYNEITASHGKGKIVRGDGYAPSTATIPSFYYVPRSDTLVLPQRHLGELLNIFRYQRVRHLAILCHAPVDQSTVKLVCKPRGWKLVVLAWERIWDALADRGQASFGSEVKDGDLVERFMEIWDERGHRRKSVVIKEMTLVREKPSLEMEHRRLM